MATSNRPRPERRLPLQQLTVLGIARFAEPVALTSVFPYLPEMIESLNVESSEVAKWAGITAAVFSLSQAVFAVPWGRASDKYGRKPVILLGLTSTMLTSILWGFSRTLWLAIAVRSLAGAGNGNVGIIRTTVAEMVPWKELQPRAFSIMPLVWNVGSVFGPALGGALANPRGIKPGQDLPKNAGLLDRFPYCLPNIISAILFLTGITFGLLFLDESLEAKRAQRDYGRDLGRKLTAAVKQLARKVNNIAHGRQTSEQEPLLKSSNVRSSCDEEDGGTAVERKTPLPPPSVRDVLTKQSILNLVCYTGLALHSIAFDQLMPIYMHSPTQDHSSSNPNFRLPLKFAGGFGLDSGRIGLLFTLYGGIQMVVQFFIFPPVARRYGVVNCLRGCSIVMPICYLLTPFTTLLPTATSQQTVVFLIMIVKGFCGTFAFPCSTILLTNSASSLRVLGTLNGVAVSTSAIGRAAGPAIAGAMFTLGVKRNFIIAPWWTLAGIAFLSAVPVFFLVEGEGFGGDDEDVEDSEDENEDEDEESNDAEEARQSREAGAMAEEDDYGSASPLPLSRRMTSSSQAIMEDSDDESNTTTPRASRRGSRAGSTPGRAAGPRRMSKPLGMGSRGISRRYSSNLGQSFGSAGGYGG